MNINVSVVVTTYHDGEYLDQLLNDLRFQDFGENIVEILLLDAGGYSSERAAKFLGEKIVCLKYIKRSGMSRTAALNYLFNSSQGGLIIRLDARSHIKSDYIKKIAQLSCDTGASNVGGVMLPIGKTKQQMIVADIMRNPAAFGGAKSRSTIYKGYVDSVYLGAYKKDRCCIGTEWFDCRHPKISEDSDLNYRIRLNGGLIYMDSSISVEHYPRENLKSFYRLCYNYGVGRGLFICKHKTFSAWRQVFPVSLFAGYILLMVSTDWNLYGVVLKVTPLAIYLFGVFWSTKDNIGALRKMKIALGVIGCHLFWVLGILVSPFIYLRDKVRVAWSTKQSKIS